MKSDDKLVRMANNIASFFRSYPHDDAVTGIHDHLKAFWTPKMRATLQAIVASGAAGPHPLVVDALTQVPRGHNPVERETAGPAEAGEIGASDAG